jgi:hypothetical protein
LSKPNRAIQAIGLAALALAGCVGPDPNGSRPEPTPSFEAPTVPTVPDGYTPAEQTAILTESIGLVYCDTAPSPDWCANFIRVEVDTWGWANVYSRFTGRLAGDPERAESMCTAIAAATYDDDAEPIGVHDVMVFGSLGDVLADCDVIPLDSGG